MDCPSRLVNAMPLRPSWFRAAALALPALFLLSACSFFEAPEIARGNRVTEDQLREIVPGVQTKNDVQALLGSPTQTSTFGDEEWFYISGKTRERPGRQLALMDQQTVVVSFDRNGVVQGVRKLTEQDSQPVTMVSRETPVPGNDRTLLQALFGNVGRFGPGAQTGPGTATGPGTMAPMPGQPR